MGHVTSDRGPKHSTEIGVEKNNETHLFSAIYRGFLTLGIVVGAHLMGYQHFLSLNWALFQGGGVERQQDERRIFLDVNGKLCKLVVLARWFGIRIGLTLFISIPFHNA